MKISTFTHSGMFPSPVYELGKDAAMTGALPTGDVVDIHAIDLMDDVDAENLLADTIDMISLDQTAALAAHGGLRYERVAELLSV